MIALLMVMVILTCYAWQVTTTMACDVIVAPADTKIKQNDDKTIVVDTEVPLTTITSPMPHNQTSQHMHNSVFTWCVYTVGF